MYHLLRNQHSTAATERSLSSIPAQAFLLLAMLIVAYFSSAKADVLAELDPDQKMRIARICAPEQFAQGANAYRQCVLDQLATAGRNPRQEASALAALSLDEQFAIQQVCNSAGADSPANTIRCTQQQIEQLEQEPAPDLSLLSDNERYLITTQCFDAQTAATARDYRVCINNAISTLDALPAADFSEEPSSARTNIQLECSLNSAKVSSYRKCLLAALGIEFTDSSVVDAASTSSENAVGSAESSNSDQPFTDIASETTQAIESNETDQPEQPALVPEATTTVQANQSPDVTEVAETAEPVEPVEPAELAELAEPAEPVELAEPTEVPETAEPVESAKPVEPVEPTEPAEPIEAAEPVEPSASSEPEALTNLDDPQVATIDGNIPPQQINSEPLTTAATTLNTLEEPEGNTDSSMQLKLVAIASAIGIPLMLLGIWLARQPDKYQRLAATSKRTTQANIASGYTQSSPERPDLRPSAPVTRSPGNTGLSNGRESVLPDSQADVAPGLKKPADRERFASWLTHLPAPRQREHAIELLIYWMAYADNRYDPALKKEIFLMKDPDAHSLIKRWVLKKEATAFADALKHLQLNTDLQQRVQIIDLLMGLLISENALTPNQNMLLRFLADAFGIGRAKLNMQFLQAFGQELPAAPRPDKTIWWKTIDADQRLRWDVHAIARQPEHIRCRIVLGQQLSGALNLQSVNKSYALAMKRCHEERASRLGERERMLLSMQRQKFMAAHDTLLEPV